MGSSLAVPSGHLTVKIAISSIQVVLGSSESGGLLHDESIDSLKLFLGIGLPVSGVRKDLILSRNEVVVELDLGIIGDLELMKLALEIWKELLKEIENFLSVSLVGEVLGQLEESLDHGEGWVVFDF